MNIQNVQVYGLEQTAPHPLPMIFVFCSFKSESRSFLSFRTFTPHLGAWTKGVGLPELSMR